MLRSREVDRSYPAGVFSRQRLSASLEERLSQVTRDHQKLLIPRRAAVGEVCQREKKSLALKNTDSELSAFHRLPLMGSRSTGRASDLRLRFFQLG